MTIAIDARFLFSTGPGRYIDRLLEHLQDVDKENRYIVILAKKDFDRWNPKSPNFTKTYSSAPQYTVREQLLFVWQLYKLKADLVHFTMPNYPIMYFRKFVVTIHDLSLIEWRDSTRGNFLYKIKHIGFKKIVWFGMHFSKRVIVPTDFVKKQIEERYRIKPEKVVRTYEATEELSKSSPKPVRTSGRFVMYVGNAYPRKNLKLLADAFALVKPRFSDLGLVYVGKMTPFYEELRDYVESKHIEGVQFTGYISDGALMHLYQNASLYVFPSLSEGFGLPGLEAMQYGVPVLAANASCLPEVYRSAAVYFDPNDANDLASKMTELLNNDQLREDLVKRGYRRLKDFSWERMVNATLEVYKEAVKQ